jgi:hypothetical protein
VQLQSEIGKEMWAATKNGKLLCQHKTHFEAHTIATALNGIVITDAAANRLLEFAQ